MKQGGLRQLGPGGEAVQDQASRDDEGDARAEEMLAYHERTKHHPARFARGPGALDWASQPDPFRTFAGGPAVDLPLLADGLATPFDGLYEPAGRRRLPG